MKKINVNIIAIFLLGIFAILTISSIWPGRKSATCDELAHHIPVGYVLLTKGDFKMDTSHPPLSRYIIAFPLKSFMHLNMPDNPEEWRKEDRSEFGKAFFYKYNNNPDTILFVSRLAIVLIGVLCGIILFIWARALYGEAIALLSLLLYSFCPNIITHSSLATTDMTATCFILLSVATFWLFTVKPSFLNLVLAGICLGLAQLSKYSAILLYLIFFILLIFELVKITDKSNKRILIVKFFLLIFISMLVLWAGYGFESQPLLRNAMRVDEKMQMAYSAVDKLLPGISPGEHKHLDNFLLNTPFPLGSHVLGVLGVLRHGEAGHGTFFMGKWSSHGNPFYFIAAFLIKTPIPAIILLILGFIVFLKNKIVRNERFILLTIAVFFITCSFSKLQLGLRYILPIYPFIFIVAAKSIELTKKKYFKILSALLIMWYIFSSISTWPNYLSYFNGLIGGSKNGYKYLRDSNIDWGQDLPALARYLKDNKIKRVKLFYFGTADPGYYGINYQELSFADYDVPCKDVYAISIQKLETVKWYRFYKPTANIGSSIFIYDFRKID